MTSARREPIIDVSAWRIAGPETLGSSSKTWLVDSDGIRWLWKEAGWNQHRIHGRFRKGDDWAEWAGAGLAHALGLPAAEVCLAERSGAAGTIGRSFLPEGHMLVLGNVLMSERDGDYPRDRPGPLAEYTVARLLGALRTVNTPLDWDDEPSTAGGVATGYLMLDAWIANVDRHHENWGVVQGVGPQRWLAPSFDHGSSMAFLLSDIERSERLTTRDRNRTPEAWAQRARSRFARLHPTEVFRMAAQEEPEAAGIWLERLHSVTPTRVTDLFASLPGSRISEASSEFAQRLLEANWNVLLSHGSRTVR